jgi:hypothetical protein
VAGSVPDKRQARKPPDDLVILLSGNLGPGQTVNGNRKAEILEAGGRMVGGVIYMDLLDRGKAAKIDLPPGMILQIRVKFPAAVCSKPMAR